MASAAFHRLAADIRAGIAGLRLQRGIQEVQRDIRALRALLPERRYDPDQPRVPAGHRDGGQWTSGGGSQVVQGYSFGVFLAEIPLRSGRLCVYRFDFGSVVVPGPVNFRCVRLMPSAGVSHGRLLNDN